MRKSAFDKLKSGPGVRYTLYLMLPGKVHEPIKVYKNVTKTPKGFDIHGREDFQDSNVPLEHAYVKLEDVVSAFQDRVDTTINMMRKNMEIKRQAMEAEIVELKKVPFRVVECVPEKLE